MSRTCNKTELTKQKIKMSIRKIYSVTIILAEIIVAITIKKRKKERSLAKERGRITKISIKNLPQKAKWADMEPTSSNVL